MDAATRMQASFSHSPGPAHIPRLDSSAPQPHAHLVSRKRNPTPCFGPATLTKPNESLQRLLAVVTCLIAPILSSAATFDVYAELLGKTILAPSGLPYVPEFASSDLPADKTNAIAFLEGEISKRGISLVQDGPDFVRLFPTGQWQAALSNAPLRGAQLAGVPDQQRIQGSTVDLLQADLATVLDIYAALKKTTVLRPAAHPPALVRFRSSKSMTRDETLYALETLLALNGFATVEDGQSFVQVVPMEMRGQVTARAPTPGPGEKAFDPTKVPSMGYSEPPRPQTKLERDLERWRKAFFELIGSNEKRNASAQRLLDLYADLTDKKAMPSKTYEAMPIWFHVTTALSKSELVYAIETTFRLNDLTITQTEDGGVRLAGGSSAPRLPIRSPEPPRLPVNK